MLVICITAIVSNWLLFSLLLPSLPLPLLSLPPPLPCPSFPSGVPGSRDGDAVDVADFVQMCNEDSYESVR